MKNVNNDVSKDSPINSHHCHPDFPIPYEHILKQPTQWYSKVSIKVAIKAPTWRPRMIWSPPPKTMMSKSSYSVSQHITHCSPSHNSCSSSHHHIFATIILFGWLLNIHSLRLSTLNICCILSRVVLLLWVMTWGRGRVVLSRWLLLVAPWNLMWVSCWGLMEVHPWGLCWVVRLWYRGGWGKVHNLVVVDLRNWRKGKQSANTSCYVRNWKEDKNTSTHPSQLLSKNSELILLDCTDYCCSMLMQNPSIPKLASTSR